MAKEITTAREDKVNPINAKTKRTRVALTAADKIRNVFNDLHNAGMSKVHPFAIGHVEKRMRTDAAINGIDIASGDLYMSVKSLTHARRPSKLRDGKASSEQDIIEFPEKRKNMDLFYDGNAYIYTDYRNKFIINPNYELKIGKGKVMKVNFVTAGKVTDPSEFSNPRYRRV